MKDWGLDLFYSRTAVMDLDDSNSSPTASHQSDFAFAFNDSNFSDRLLRIEIIANSPDARSESDGCCGLADWAGRLCDLRRRDIAEKRHASDVSNCPEEQVYDCQQPDVEDGIGDEDNDEVSLKMIEDSPSDESAKDDAEPSEEDSRVLRVKTLHISSPILAAKSPFFYKRKLHSWSF